MRIPGWLRKGRLNPFNRRSGEQRRELMETRNPLGGGPKTFTTGYGIIRKDVRSGKDRRKTFFEKLFRK